MNTQPIRALKLLVSIFLLVNLSACQDNAVEKKPAAAKKQSNVKNSDLQGNQNGLATDDEDMDDSCDSNFSDSWSATISASGKAKVPIIGSISFNFAGDAGIDISSTSSRAKFGIDVNVSTFSPKIAKSLATKIVNSYKDPLQLTLVPAAERANFFATTPGWKGLNCLVLPVTKIKSATYEYEFSPALPMMISPNLTQAEAQAKVKGTINFPNITSKLIRHFHPNSVAKRGSYQGSASLKRSGNSYKISFDFGTKAPSALATPMQSIEYQVNNNQSNFDQVTIWAFASDDSLFPIKVTK